MFLLNGYKKAFEASQGKQLQQLSSSTKNPSTQKKAALSANSSSKKNAATGYTAPSSDRHIYQALIEVLGKENLTPVVIFTFSRKKCEDNADGLSNRNLNSSSEQSQVHVFIEKVVGKLKLCDRNLPQIIHLKDMLKRGIGVHHSGLLPIMKESVEILFSKGLVKVLFATETFAMGVNMPARCVVFDSIRKHDGQQFRELLAGEYTQMAGRAGRRGLDKTGTVIILCKTGDLVDASVLNSMILGKPTILSSKFRLTFLMILNLLRVEELRVEDVMKRSFFEFDFQKGSSTHLSTLSCKKKQKSQMEAIDGPYGIMMKHCRLCRIDLFQFCHIHDEWLHLQSRLNQSIAEIPSASSRAFIAGRVVFIRIKHAILSSYIFVAGIFLKPQTYLLLVDSEFLLVFSPSDSKSLLSLFDPRPWMIHLPESLNSVQLGESIPYGDIVLITPHKLALDSCALLDEFSSFQLEKKKNAVMLERNLFEGRPVLSQIIQQFRRVVEQANSEDGFESLDIQKDLKLNDLTLVEMWRNASEKRQAMRRLDCVQCFDLRTHFETMKQYRKISQEIVELRYQISDSSLHMLPEYHNRIQTLIQLGYIDSSYTVQLKGRVACEISTCDELLVAELIFENVFAHMEPSEVAAALSSLVYQGKNCLGYYIGEDDSIDCSKLSLLSSLPESLKSGISKITSVAIRIAQVESQCGMDIHPKEYICSTINLAMVETVYAWCRGDSFCDIALRCGRGSECEQGEILEGTIVRCITRLAETCRDVRNAARVIGDPALYQKMEQASALMKRDIVFAASLYTT